MSSVGRTGDVNLDGLITAGNIIGLINFIFKEPPEPVPCKAAGDVNCSGTVTSADTISLVGFVFKGDVRPCDACGNSPPAALCP
jgi:hypothetical protein